jgi:Domain of unknown function (DUF4262)
MLRGFKPPIPSDDCERKVLSDVKNFGWHVINILPDENGPQYSFSIGLYHKFGHPELLVMGLPHPVGHQLINSAAEQIAAGKSFRSLDRADELAEGFTCGFLPVSVMRYKEYLGCAIWFYHSLKHPFPALQLVWPDKRGRLPWEKSYDKRFHSLQPLLNEET